MDEQLTLTQTDRRPLVQHDIKHHLWLMEIAAAQKARAIRELERTQRCSECGGDFKVIQIERPILTSYGDAWSWQVLDSFAHDRSCYFAVTERSAAREAAEPLDPWE